MQPINPFLGYSAINVVIGLISLTFILTVYLMWWLRRNLDDPGKLAGGMLNVMPQIGTLLATVSIAMLTYQSVAIAEQAFRVAQEARDSELRSRFLMAKWNEEEGDLTIHERYNREIFAEYVILVPVYRDKGPNEYGEPVSYWHPDPLVSTRPDEPRGIRIPDTKSRLCSRAAVGKTESEAVTRNTARPCHTLRDIHIIVKTDVGVEEAVIDR